MATIATTASTIAAEMQRYYDKLFLERMQNFQKFSFLAVPKTLPKNAGKIVYFTRVAQLTANITALTDGTSPTGINSTASNVIATAEPYGAFELIGRQFELTTIDSGLKEHVEVMAQNAGESLDIVLGNAMTISGACTSGLCANSAQMSAIASTDTLSVSGIRNVVKTLKINKAPTWENGMYRGVVGPDGIYQLQGDTAAGNWINMNMYNSGENAENLKKARIQGLYGVDIVESTVQFCATADEYQATPGNTACPSGVWAFFAGKGAVAEVKLQGNGDSRIIYKQGGDQDTSNPLNMYSTLGWKVEGYAAKVLNPYWLVRYTHFGTAGGGTGGRSTNFA
jgi:N4-gp56 family major capsid protein